MKTNHAPMASTAAVAAIRAARALKPAPVEVLHLPDINHLLAPAKTGEVSEYDSLPEKTISPAVAKAIVDWLKK